jgi:hypothetical protein
MAKNRYSKNEENEVDPRRFYVSCTSKCDDLRTDSYPTALERYNEITAKRESWRRENNPRSAILWDMSTAPPTMLECNFEPTKSITPSLSIQNDNDSNEQLAGKVPAAD